MHDSPLPTPNQARQDVFGNYTMSGNAQGCCRILQGAARGGGREAEQEEEDLKSRRPF